MNNYRDIFISLFWRLPPTIAVGGLGWHILAHARGGFGAIGQLLFGMACLVTAAVIIASPIAKGIIVDEPDGLTKRRYHPGGYNLK